MTLDSVSGLGRVGVPRSIARIRGVALPAAGAVVLVGVVEGLRLVGVLPEHAIPPASDVADALYHQLGDHAFWESVLATVQAWAIALGVVAAIAVPAGLVIGVSRRIYTATRALIEILRPIPPVALIPLAVLIYGTGLRVAIFLAVIGAIWPLLVQSIYGARSVDPMLRDFARAYGLGRRRELAFIIVPGAMPYIATGLRIAAAVSLLLAVTAGVVLGSPGLGSEIALAQSGGAVALMYALIVATGILGIAISIIFARIERRALRWHPSQRTEVDS